MEEEKVKKSKSVDIKQKYRDLFSSHVGREVLLDILKHAGVFTAQAAYGNEQYSAIREGRRTGALAIAEKVFKPEKLNEELSQMMEEKLNDNTI